MIVDLRSDTLTQPNATMLEFMKKAKVGDDVFDEDPTIHELQHHTARLFEKEAALFCPSGTMANQIAIKVHTQPAQEVICHEHSHVYLYEGGGMAFNSGVSVKLLQGDYGKISALQIVDSINPDNVHYPITSLVVVENTSNKGGGSCYTMDELKAIKAVCSANNLKLHLDGARIFNAIVASQYTAAQIGDCVDTLSVCLSKGLGAPVGSLLLGNAETINKARRLRKVFGGGMRQAGFLAAAGLYALQHNVVRLAEDHQRAQAIAKALSACYFTESIMPVESNIIVFKIKDEIASHDILELLKSKGILTVPFGKQLLRMVLHLDINQSMVDYTIATLTGLTNK
ncbi:MAG: threonine aldolase [Bacteroidetes bacterium]|nr:threonine aldolase [Bacteroidota bacterium]